MSQGLLHGLLRGHQTKTSCSALSPKEFAQVSSLRKKDEKLALQTHRVRKCIEQAQRLARSLGDFSAALIKSIFLDFYPNRVQLK